MSFLGKRVRSRFPIVGRFGDLMIVGNAGLRFAHRKGLIDDDMAKKFGAESSAGGAGLSPTEIALIVGAALRVLGRSRAKKR